MKKSIIKKLIILGIIIYAVITFINQQQTINKYKTSSAKLEKQIEEQKQYKEELAQKQADVGSLDFIEQTAREKLDMYLPNERVYLDKGN